MSETFGEKCPCCNGKGIKSQPVITYPQIKRYKIDDFDGLAAAADGYLCYYDDYAKLEAENRKYWAALEQIEIGFCTCEAAVIAKQALENENG